MKNELLNLKKRCCGYQDENTRMKTHNQQLFKEIKNNERVIEEILQGGPGARRAAVNHHNSSLVVAMKRQVREQRLTIEGLHSEVQRLMEDESYMRSQGFQKQNKTLRMNI